MCCQCDAGKYCELQKSRLRHAIIRGFTALTCRIGKNSGTLAQLVEQWTFNPFVVGSTPARPTKIFNTQVLDSKGLLTEAFSISEFSACHQSIPLAFEDQSPKSM